MIMPNLTVQLHTLLLAAAEDDITQTSTPTSSNLNPAINAVKETKIYETISTISAALGLLIVMIGIIQLGLKYLSGKTVGAARQGLMIVGVGALMTIPGIAISLLGAGGNVISNIVDSISKLLGS